MPVAAKAFWTVTAGIIPDEPMPEHTRQWGYTSVDYEHDRTVPEDQPQRFAIERDEPRASAASMMDPRGLNWVKLEWAWI